MLSLIERAIIFAALIIRFVQYGDAKAVDCSDSHSSTVLKSLSIDGCDLNSIEPCRFVQTTNATIEVEFMPTKTINQANVQVYGQLGVFKVPFPLHPSDACGNYGFDCPVNANEVRKLRISLPILRTYPRISLKVQLSMYDEQKEQLVCIEFPAKITS